MHCALRSFFRPLAATFLLCCVARVAPARAQDAGVDASRRAAAAMVRPGDRIELQFRRDRELNSSINVNERGEAVFPKLGVLDLSDVSIAKLQDSLVTRYSEYLRRP